MRDPSHALVKCAPGAHKVFDSVCPASNLGSSAVASIASSAGSAGEEAWTNQLVHLLLLLLLLLRETSMQARMCMLEHCRLPAHIDLQVGRATPPKPAQHGLATFEG